MELTSGKTAVVTGAASGIGFALAERFARAGLDIVLADDDFGNFPAYGAQPVDCVLECSLGSHFMIVKQCR